MASTELRLAACAKMWRFAPYASAIMIRRSIVSYSAALAAVAGFPAMAQAPKTLRLIVPFPAGGATDILARALSLKLGEKLGTTVVVDNKPGAGGSIGSDLAAKAAPDGLTVLLATSSTHSIGPALNAKLPYNAQTDFTPIGLVANSPSVVLVPNSSPAKNMKEFIALAKSKPGQLNYASSGNGTIIHLSSELLKSMSNTFLVHIPYRGSALAMPDLISGKIDVLVDAFITGMPHVRDGKLRALAITSAKRSALAPELPTVAETLPGYESSTWFGMYGPRGLPAEATNRINAALNAALSDPELKDRLARLGAEVQTSTPEAFGRTVQADHAKWKAIIEARKITLEG
jgi:tripartite-type tricarboxylate transporter receptor subunit TctC